MLASEEASLDSASLRDLRSMTDLALRATKPPPKPLDARCPAPPLAHDDGDERGNFVRLSRRSDQAACLDQLWRALLNASRRLRSHLRLCDTSSLNAPALPLLPVALDLHRLSRQLNQRQPPWSPDLRRIVR